MARRTALALQEAFKKWDDDGNGTITREELATVLCTLGNFKPAQIDKILDEADTNKDGVIDYDEFIQWLAAPAAPAEATAAVLLSECIALLRAEAPGVEIPATTQALAGVPASWDFSGDDSKALTMKKAVELGLNHTIVIWLKLEALKGDPFISLVSDPMWGLHIGLSSEGGFAVEDPRNKGFVADEVPAPEEMLDKWVFFCAIGRCSTPSSTKEGSTTFYVGSNLEGVRKIGAVQNCASGLVLRDFGCSGQGLASMNTISVWPRALQEPELKELFMWDAQKLGCLTAQELSWCKLNRRQIPDRSEEEEELFSERLQAATDGKAPGGCINVAGLKISDKDLPRILEAMEAAYDTVGAILLTNNYITEDGIVSDLVPFVTILTLPLRLNLSGNKDLGQAGGEALLAALPPGIAWSVDVNGTQISSSVADKLMNDTPEASDKARGAANERRRTGVMVEEYEQKQAELEKKWAPEIDKAVDIDEDVPLPDIPAPVAKGKKPKKDEKPKDDAEDDGKEKPPPTPYAKFPEGKQEQLKIVRTWLTSNARNLYDRNEGGSFGWATQGARSLKFPPTNCATGQFLAHFSYLGYQMNVRKPEDFGLRQRKPGETMKCIESAVALHEAVENSKIKVSGVIGKSFGRGAIVLSLTNLSQAPLRVQVPTGTIFQHTSWIHHQNLLVGRDVIFDLEGGASQTKKMGGYCMNVTCGCSDKDPMQLTSLLMENPDVLASQGKVWDHFEGIFEEMRTDAGFKVKKGKKGKGKK